MTNYTKTRISIYFAIILFSSLNGLILTYLFSYESNHSLLIGLIVGFLISTFLIILDLIWVKYFKKRSSILLEICAKLVIYTLVIILSFSLAIFLVLGPSKLVPTLSKYIIKVLIISAISIFIFTFIININRLLGQRALYRLFLGMYHKPAEVFRYVMFIDLSHSTTIAEQIGNKNFLSFLNEVYYDITPAIMEAKGEIYKYVGDEIIITWNKKAALKNCNVLFLFFNICTILKNKNLDYQETYGVIPEFRAGLHCGPTIIGELGDVKQEIAFLGDVLNTAARLRTECSIQNVPLLTTSDVIQNLTTQIPSTITTTSRGHIELRGKENKTEIIQVNYKNLS